MSFELRLSGVELAFIHALGGRPPFPGAPAAERLGGFDGAEPSLREGLASLGRRGLARQDGATARMSPELAAVSRLLFAPEGAVLRWDESDDAPDGFEALGLVGGFALRWSVEGDQWRGAVTQAPAAALRALCGPVPDAAPPGPAPLELAGGEFLALRARAKGAATAGDAASAWAGVLARQRRQHVFAGLITREGVATDARNVLIVAADDGCRALEPVGDDAARLRLIATSRAALVRGFTGWFAARGGLLTPEA